MRMLFGCKVPEAARVLEVKSNPGGAGRPRTIFRGPLDEAGNYTLTEDAVIDAVCADPRFWDWVTVQQRSRRLLSQAGVADGGVVTLRLTVSFLNQDGSLAVLDEGTGATSFSCPDTWEFHKTASMHKDTDPMTLVIELSKAIVEQQKLMPEVMVRMFKEMSESGRVTIQTSAAESAKLLQASIEPLKSQLAIIEKSHTHESTRADRASDAVIRMLMSDPKEKESVSEPEKLIGFLTALLALAEKGKKVLN